MLQPCTSTNLARGVDQIGRAIDRTQLDVGVVPALHPPGVTVSAVGDLVDEGGLRVWVEWWRRVLTKKEGVCKTRVLVGGWSGGRRWVKGVGVCKRRLEWWTRVG